MAPSINRDNLIHGLSLETLTGIEIGPLVNPVVTREMSNVKYVDRASTEELREWYSNDDTINTDQIVSVDYIWGAQSLAEATGDNQQFDYCIASHVIEHIPDLITWLGEIASVLKTGGVASFAVPDKRYTFDCLRSPTTPADIIDCYLNKLRKPSFRHVYDHFSKFVDVDINQVWAADFDITALTPQKSAADTYAVCLDALHNDKYIDTHCSVFTEDSFFDLLATIAELGLLDFRIKRNFSVRNGMFEFFVQLEKIDPDLSTAEKYSLFATSREQMQSCWLAMKFLCNTACSPKLYFSHTDRFNETESIEQTYQTADVFQDLKFKLPLMEGPKLRFDPCDCEADIEISDISYCQDGEQQQLDLSRVVVLQDITTIENSGNKLTIKTTAGRNDPALLIQL